ncbi:MAG TPA: ferrochelatase [Vineibacter sp.]|nr:ferrochelatase [Vineibacter sp.]
MSRIAVILFNLGGPDSPQAVEPFLRNLFVDPAILRVPGLVRRFLAPFIARRRAPTAQAIYAQMGGRSPILPQTEAQAAALDAALAARASAYTFRSFIAMRYWHPFSAETAAAVKTYAPDRIVLLPLYPQMSTATSESSVIDWRRSARSAGLDVPTQAICCYPTQDGLIATAATLIRRAYDPATEKGPVRLLFSAHGLPEKVIRAGDPYQWQVERTARSIVDRLAIADLDWAVCYQSRVGPLKWIGPSTDSEIRRAGSDGKAVVLFPIAFVSEHSETLVELDIEYRELAHQSGVRDYQRVATVGVEAAFIDGLADLVLRTAADAACAISNDAGVPACSADFSACPRRAGSGATKLWTLTGAA